MEMGIEKLLHCTGISLEFSQDGCNIFSKMINFPHLSRKMYNLYLFAHFFNKNDRIDELMQNYGLDFAGFLENFRSFK